MKFSLKKAKKQIYLDHAAATPVDADVLAAMKPYLTEVYANPSALHRSAVQARKAIDKARGAIADLIHAQPDTIFFAGSTTEANNIALLGVARKHSSLGRHIVTSAIEHSSVLEPMKQLEKEGVSVTYVKPNRQGVISADDVREAIREDTILVSIMYANNEVGSIMPIAEIGRMILKWRKERKTQYPLLHTDAAQATNYLSLDVEKLHVDLMAISAAKMYGPKGCGILYKRRDVVIDPIIYGGGQESGLRAGTENVAYIVGTEIAF